MATLIQHPSAPVSFDGQMSMPRAWEPFATIACPPLRMTLDEHQQAALDAKADEEYDEARARIRALALLDPDNLRMVIEIAQSYGILTVARWLEGRA